VEEIKKRIIGNVVRGFIAKNIQICIFGGGNLKRLSQS